MSSTNHITVAGSVLSQAYESVTQSGSKVVKRHMAIFNHSFKNVKDENNESYLTVILDTWRANLQETLESLEEGTPVLIEGSFHIYKLQTSEGTKTTYSITVENILPLPEQDVTSLKWNRITVVGRTSFGRDKTKTDFRDFGDSAVSNFSLAVNRPAKNADPDWFNISAWDNSSSNLATRCHTYLEKGRLIAVQGQLTFSTFTSSQTGEEVTRLEVRMSDFQFLGGKNNGESTNGNGNENHSHSESTSQPQPQPQPQLQPQPVAEVTPGPKAEDVRSTSTTSADAPVEVEPKAKSRKSAKKAATPELNLEDVPF
jgi:single stranded DNA-binding protein